VAILFFLLRLSGVERISGSVSAAAKTPISDIRKMDLKSKDDTDKDVKDEEEASAPTEPKSIPDLGARLGAAAMANENMRQQAEKERLERQKRMEEEKKEYERRAEEMARQRQAEIMRMEAEQAEKRRKAEEEQRKAEEEKKQKEKERLDALMKAQEEYWAKKLAKERAAKEEKLVEKEKQKEEEAEMAVEEGKEEIAAAVDVKPAKTAERFNPDERNLLELVRSVSFQIQWFYECWSLTWYSHFCDRRNMIERRHGRRTKKLLKNRPRRFLEKSLILVTFKPNPTLLRNRLDANRRLTASESFNYSDSRNSILPFPAPWNLELHRQRLILKSLLPSPRPRQ